MNSMNKYYLIGSNSSIAEADSLVECHSLMEEAEKHGFDVVDILHAHSMQSVMIQVVNLYNEPDPYLFGTDTDFSETDIPF